jgi:hypothetical protein
MAKAWQKFRRRLAPVSLKLWPALSNPAWLEAAAADQFGAKLIVAVAPLRITHKLESEATATLRNSFLVDGLDRLSRTSIRELYTYQDMVDIAEHGEDWRATRLGRWLLAGIAAGRPPAARGAIIRTHGQAERYYRSYLEMYRSMQANGYRYDGDDEMCFGIGRDGHVMLMRRGTHRLAAAQILELPQVTGRVTHIDRGFVRATMRNFAGTTVAEAIIRGVTNAVRP